MYIIIINNKLTIVCVITAGPSIDESMKLTLLTSNVADPPFPFRLSFTITFGLPSRMVCTRDGIDLGFENSLTGTRGQLSGVTYTVVDPWYMDSLQPSVVCISFTQSRTRATTTYSCTVYVEGRKNVTGGYDFDQLGNGTTTATITGE